MNNCQPRKRRRTTALGVGLLMTVTLAACGGTEPADPGAADNLTMRVALQPIPDSAPIWLGISKGFFAEQGVTVEVVPGAASSSGQIPLLLSRQAEVAATTSAAALQAASQNVDVQVVAGLTSWAPDAERDQSALVVGKDSSVSSYKDLVGKTVALAGLKSVTQAAVMGAVAKAGGDPAGVKFIQVPLPNIGNTVATKGADAGFLVDPFLSVGVADGLKTLGHPISEITGGLPGTSLVTTTTYANANGPALKKFTAALSVASAYSAEHPDEVIAATAEATKVPLEKLKGSKNPVFDARVDPELLSREADLLNTYGALDKPVDATALIWKG